MKKIEINIRDLDRLDDIISENALNYDEDSIVINEREIPLENLYYSNVKISFPEKIEALKKSFDFDLSVSKYSSIFIDKLFKSYKKDKINKFLRNYPIFGSLKLEAPDEKLQEEICQKFEEKYGRVPAITEGLTSVCHKYYYDDPEIIVSSFNILKTREGKLAGLSEAEIGLLLCETVQTESPAIFKSENAYYAIKCFDKGLTDKNEKYIDAGRWITAHPETKEKVIKKVTKFADYLNLNLDTSIGAVKAQISNLKGIDEIEAIEKAYKKPGFKFKDCIFDLKYTISETDKYKAFILEPGDTRMARLGHDTNCCQRLGEAGESAMMHGFLNPKAGFWAIEEKGTGRILAQAEIWEKPGDDTVLVFDNIEFANDADIGLYKEILTKWLSESAYPTIIMGNGYNRLYNSRFTPAPAITPSVDAYEIYVLSYEDDSLVEGKLCEISSVEKAQKILDNGEATYYDYVYCDSENRASYLKENGELSPYFTENLSSDNRNEDYDEEYEEYEDSFDEEYNETY